jgi:hypothetical protein
MAMDDVEFERLLNAGGFTTEAMRLNESANALPAFGVERVTPDRGRLLEVFYDILSSYRDLCEQEEWAELSARFAEEVVLELDVSPMDLIMIKNPGSYQDAERVMAGQQGSDVIGRFGMMHIQPWYDLSFEPVDLDMSPDGEVLDFPLSIQAEGLYVHMQGASVRSPDILGREAVGNIEVPLNHGAPEIFKIHHTK